MEKKKVFHKALSVAMIACLLAGSASVGTATWSSNGGAGLAVSAATTNKIVKSGKCGEKVTYTLDSNGTLTISGSGAMYDDWKGGPFSYDSTIKNVIIKNGITSIGICRFYHCTGLESITLPNSVTSIGDKAFYGCTGLESITLPNSVTSIGDEAFDETAWYNSQQNGVVYAGKVAYKYKGDMPENTSITLKSGTKEIANSAFYGCTGLKSITIPNSVTSIRDGAFGDCTGLESITLPNSITIIGSQVFDGCTGLKNITIPNSVTSIGYDAFCGCTGLKNINIPNSVTSIGSNAFGDTAWYNSQPNGVVYAGKIAYKYKGDMPKNTSITLKSETKGIAGSAFYGCTGLKNITIPNSVTSIGDEAFFYCTGLKNITIPNSVTSIGYDAFCGCTGLKNINIPNSVTSIGSDAFAETAWYNSQPNGVVYVGKIAYKYKGDMPENVTLKDGTIGIASSALYSTNLKSITIPNSVKYIEEYAISNHEKSGEFDGTIQSYRGSAAEKYAKENGIEFVSITKVSAEKVTLNKGSITLGKGESYSLKATVAPSNASNKSVSYSSSNSKIVSVDKNGKITAKNTGSATITAKTSNGKTATCKVTVKSAASKIYLNRGEMKMGIGETFKLTTWVNNGAASAKRGFKSSDNSICYVSGNGELKAKKAGTVTITAWTFNNKKATCKITVKPAASKIYMNKSKLTLKVGDTFKLTTWVNDGAASNKRGFKSSNNSICYTSGKGELKAKKKGTVTITAWTFNNKSTTCTVTVK